MKSVLLLAIKDLRLLSRDRMALFWALVFPVAFAVFMGSVMSANVSRSSKLELVGLDDARTPASQGLFASLSRTDGIEITMKDELREAERLVSGVERVAYLRAPPGFGVDPRVGLVLGTDPSRSREAALVRASIDAALAPPSERPRLTEVTVTGSSEARSPWELVFPTALLWGLMGCAATFAAGMASERAQGTHLRLRALALPESALLGGKALAAALACAFDAALLLAVARWGFGVVPDSWTTLGLSVASITVCFVGLTMFLSTLGRTEQAVSGAGWATLLFMAMLGGAMVPVSLMPGWLQTLSDASPVKWAILALEGAIWRGVSDAELLRAWAVLVIGGALAFVLGVVRTRRSEA